MRTNILFKGKGLVKVLPFYLFTFLLLVGCADLDYTEETTRDEAWTYEYFENGIKNLVFDVYAQVYNNEFDANSAYFLAGATDEAQYALTSGTINSYTKYSQRLLLPDDVDKSKISARVEDGILTVRLPKLESVVQNVGRQIDIE